MDAQVQQFIQAEVKKQLETVDRLNAKNTRFQQNTGLSTQGQNVLGPFGDKILHSIFRPQLTEQTIASGEINLTSMSMLIDTEGAAASDNLDTINIGTLVYKGEEIITLRAADDAHTVVIKNGTGNIISAGDFSMDSVNDCIWLRWDALQLKWIEVYRHDSSDTNGYVTYSPTLTGDGGSPAIGTGGVLTGRYRKKGTEVVLFIKWTLGTAFSFGTGTVYFSLPFPVSSSALSSMSISALEDVGTGLYYGINLISSSATTTDGSRVQATSGTYALRADATSTVPFTWVAGDIMQLGPIIYEAST